MALQTTDSAGGLKRGRFLLRRRWLACLHSMLLLLLASAGNGIAVADQTTSLRGFNDIPNPWAEGDDELKRGNLAPMEMAIQRQDLPSLWHCYRQALEEKYQPANGASNGTLGSRQRLNSAIAKCAATGLRQIPGHALFLADEVEALSQRPFPPYAEAEVRQAFHMLGALGGPEAIQQIARFLDDQRDFYAPSPPSKVPQVCGFATPVYPASVHAASALHQALSGDSPLFDKVPPGALVLGNDLAEMQHWWHSWQARSYRKQLPGVPLPEWQSIPGRFPLPKWHQRLSPGLMTTLLWSGILAGFVGLVWWSRSLRLDPSMQTVR